MITHNSTQRIDGRSFDQLRPVRVTFDPYGYAAASVLFELGKTKVLCSISLQQHVPPFLKGSKSGWLTAEYAMLPGSTHNRTAREDGCRKKDGRCVEISRLIGRSLRTILNLKPLGEQTIIVDCDVLQADAGTRTAAITGSCLALELAISRWMANGQLHENILLDRVAAVSVGLLQENPLLDPVYAEDARLDADFNFVLTQSGTVIEIQGTAEHKPVAWTAIEQMNSLARMGVAKLFESCQQEVMTIPDRKSTQLATR